MSEQTGGPQFEMPRYRSHKEVWALKILAIEFEKDGSAVIASDFEPLRTKANYRTRWHGSEDDPGYYVRYEDGYESWSPSKAFEDGYTRI